MADLETASCCIPTEQATCCEPAEKADCCGTDGQGLGCQSRQKTADEADGPAELREAVLEGYAAAAKAVGADASCGCGSAALTDEQKSVFGAALYEGERRDALLEAATLASLGCGNPTAVAELKPGEVVLDLGSGGGIDVLLSAKRVGSNGRPTAST